MFVWIFPRLRIQSKADIIDTVILNFAFFYMPLNIDQKQEIIKEFQTAEGDTGSPEVQIALLTRRIERLTEHLKGHAHDNHSRRGLLSMIAKRRRLINFLGKVDKSRSSKISKKIGLKN